MVSRISKRFSSASVQRLRGDLDILVGVKLPLNQMLDSTY